MTLETSRTRAGGWALLAALAVVAAAVACASGGASTAPAGATPAVAAHVGRFVWHDLVTRDAAACQKFYGALLGWDFKETTRDGHPYFLAQSGGSFAGGIVPLAGAAPGPAAWLSYLSVPDLDRAVAQVGSAGGKVLLQPRAVGAYGRVAVVTDPQGAPLGLAGVTGEIPAEPGAAPRQPVLLDGVPGEGRPGGARLLQEPGGVRLDASPRRNTASTSTCSRPGGRGRGSTRSPPTPRWSSRTGCPTCAWRTRRRWRRGSWRSAGRC